MNDFELIEALLRKNGAIYGANGHNYFLIYRSDAKKYFALIVESKANDFSLYQMLVNLTKKIGENNMYVVLSFEEAETLLKRLKIIF